MTDAGPEARGGRRGGPGPAAPGDAADGGLDDALEEARAALAAGRPEDAAATLTSLLSRLDAGDPSPADARRRVRASSLLGVIAFEADGVTAALAHLDEAAATARAIDDRELVASTWAQRAAVLGRSGRMEESLAALDQAAAGLDALGGRDATIVLMNRGTARAQLGDLEGAIADLRAAAAAAERHDLAIERFMATHNLGYLHHLRGDEPAALRAMEAADALDADVARGVGLLDRGRVLLEAGLADEAAAVLERAIEVCAGDGHRQAEGEAVYELARARLLAGHADEALTLVRTAATRFAELASTAWLARCHLTELRLALQLHRRAAATGGDAAVTEDGAADVAGLAAAGRSLAADLAGGPGPVGRTARALAAEALALAGDGDGAAALLAEHLGPTPPPPAPLLTVRLDEHRALVALAQAAGDDETAERRLVAAARDLERAAMSATTLDLRTARVAHATALAGTDLARALPAGPLATLAAIERWRAPSSRLPPVRPTSDPHVTELLTARRQLREELRDAPAPPPAAWAELAALEDRIAGARRTAAVARRDTTATAPVDPDATAPVDPDATAPVDPDATAPVDHPALLAALAADGRDLLVTAVVGDDVVAVDVHDGAATLRTVGPAAELSALARRVRADLAQLPRAIGPLAQPIRSSLQATAATLGQRMLGPVGARREGRLLVVAHGDLVGLPWGLLAPGRPTVEAASASAWVRAGRGPGTGAATGRRRDVRIVRGPGLVAADEEAAAVAAAWGTTPPDALATSTELVDALASGDVVHVAAHGRHHRQQPLFSSLRVGDGPCSLYDLETSGVGASIVVLASCDAASATIRPGDEPVGLATGLLALGARSVVAPVSPVPDELLPPVMARLHRGLAAGLPTDEALVDAAALDRTAAAAFVVSGVAS